MAKKDEEMITPKSSQILGMKAQSESEQPPKLQQELESSPSSVGESAVRTGTDVQTDTATVDTTSVEGAEDAAANLFPPPLPKPRICMWKYLDIHSMHKLDKAATVEAMRDRPFHQSRHQQLVPCSKIFTRPVLLPLWATWRNATTTLPAFSFAMESGLCGQHLLPPLQALQICLHTPGSAGPVSVLHGATATQALARRERLRGGGRRTSGYSTGGRTRNCGPDRTTAKCGGCPPNLYQEPAEQGAGAAPATGGGTAQGERGKAEQQTGCTGAAPSVTSQQRQEQAQVIPSIFSNKDLGQSTPPPTFTSTF
ncbi:cilia- and flagella-associated protein 119 isoform X3 [Psammomys obesus]|uniref:cilia- and flagella-associated protein 119 isoform X3 n=1 Tax=Psammomys obesus TaxID=48139 RepID=UPI0024528D33|nr:cilia- and flagella-associated protein 119 isoform X3 [Psammomys obesus]